MLILAKLRTVIANHINFQRELWRNLEKDLVKGWGSHLIAIAAVEFCREAGNFPDGFAKSAGVQRKELDVFASAMLQIIFCQRGAAGQKEYLPNGA